MNGINDWARQAIADVGKKLIGYQELVEGCTKEELEALRVAAADTKRDIEIQLIQRKADLAEESNRCFALGIDGKKDWFRYQAEYLAWRGVAISAKGHMESLLSHLKLKVQSGRQDVFDAKTRLLFEAQQLIDDRHTDWHERANKFLNHRSRGDVDTGERK